MTPAQRGARLGGIAAKVVPAACVAIGVAVGAVLRPPAVVAELVGIIGALAIAAWFAFAARELRIVEREEAAEKAKPAEKTPEQIGAEIYALHKKPLTITIELNPKGREAVMQLAAKKKMSAEDAYLYAVRIATEGDGEIKR